MLLRYGLRAAIIVIPALLCVSGVRAETSAEAKKAIQTAYIKRDAAAQKKDVNGALSAYSPNFVYISKDGQKGDLKVLKKKLIPLFALMQSVKATTSLQSFEMKGKQATARVKEHLEMLVVNPNTQIPQKFIADEVSDDLWTKSGNSWLQKQSKTRSQKATMDGKSIEDKLDLSPSASRTPANKRLRLSPPRRMD